jgi:HK97 family phage major capsid protein
MQSEYARYKEQQQKTIGLNFGRAIKCLAVGRGDPGRAMAFAEQHNFKMSWLETFLTKASIPAGTTSDATWAGPIALPTPLSTELVKLLYPIDVISQLLALGARRVPFNILFPRVNVGTSAAWAAPGNPVPVSKQSLDTISLGIYKTAGIVVLTQELARSTFLDVATTISADMVESLAKFRNTAAFNPDNAGVPLESPSSLNFGLDQIQSSGTTIAALTADAGMAMDQLTTNGVPLTNAVWVMSERLGGYISRLRTTTGASAFPTMSAKGGEWFGLPVLTSGAEIESNSPTESFFTLLDVGSIAIAQDDTPVLDVSKSGSMQLLDNPSTGATSNVSLWQMNLIAVRAVMAANFIRRRDVAVAIVRGINL